MGDWAQPVTGGCLCGAVRYEAEVFLQSAYYCHCKSCQKSSGQPAEMARPDQGRFAPIHQGGAEILSLVGMGTAWILSALWVPDHLAPPRSP